MEALALAGLVVVAIGFSLQRLVELRRLSRDQRLTTPAVIRSVPLGFTVPPQPYQSSTTSVLNAPVKGAPS